MDELRSAPPCTVFESDRSDRPSAQAALTFTKKALQKALTCRVRRKKRECKIHFRQQKIIGEY